MKNTVCIQYISGIKCRRSFCLTPYTIVTKYAFLLNHSSFRSINLFLQKCPPVLLQRIINHSINLILSASESIIRFLVHVLLHDPVTENRGGFVFIFLKIQTCIPHQPQVYCEHEYGKHCHASKRIGKRKIQQFPPDRPCQ